jgi:hypothetical protein
MAFWYVKSPWPTHYLINIQIWRLHILWRHNWLISGPFVSLCPYTPLFLFIFIQKIVLLCGAASEPICYAGRLISSKLFPLILVCSYMGLSYQARFSPMVLESLGNWLLSMLSLSLSTQLGATLLIAYRIWADTAWGTKYTMMVFWIIIESGALYGFTTAIFLGLHLANAHASAIPGAALGQICVSVPSVL